MTDLLLHHVDFQLLQLLSDSTLDQFEVSKTLVGERDWGRGGKFDEDGYEVLILHDSLRKILPDLVILIDIEGVQCACLILQDLLQSCLRGGRGIVEDMCYERRRAEACVD